jgi:hypothetical protein
VAPAETGVDQARTSENSIKAKFAGMPHSLGPMGENFSGSCIVTSRNSLIHIGATTATKSGRFDPKGAPQGLSSSD